MARDLNRIFDQVRGNRNVNITQDGTVEHPDETEQNAQREAAAEGTPRPRTRLKPEVFGAGRVLRMHAKVLEAMHAEAGRHEGETGAIVLGPDEHTISELLVSGPNAKRTSSSYMLDVDYLQPLLDKADGRGLRFLGVWHLHPEGCTELSHTDRATARRMLRDPDYHVRRLILPLTTRSKGGFETRFFVAEGLDAAITPVVPVIVHGKDSPLAHNPADAASVPALTSSVLQDSRLARDCEELEAAGCKATLEDADGGRVLLIERYAVRLWCLLPPEYPLGPPDVFLEEDSGLREILHQELPETHHWSSVRSIALVAEQAFTSVRAKKEAERLLRRRPFRRAKKLVTGLASAVVRRIGHV